MTHAAFSHAAKGDKNAFQAQALAFDVVSKSALAQQQAWFARVFRPAEESGASPGSSGAVPGEVRVIAWQWDETSQRIKAMLRKDRLPGERVSHKKVATQIMMQAGLLSAFKVGDRCCALASSEEWLCRGLKMAETNSDYLLEGMARAMPAFFDDVADVLRLCTGASLVIVSLCCDRASPNFRACAWLWKQMASPQLSHRIFPHIEPCALHGINLVKCRATGGKALITVMSSLGCLMRGWRFSDRLREEIHLQVGRRLRVVESPQPEDRSARAERLAQLLFAGDSDNWLYRQSSSGERSKSQVLLDIEALVAAVDFGNPDSEEIIHYCCIQEGDAAHAEGAAPGGPCCRDRQESVDKVSAPLIQWFCHRAWEQAADSRWTKIVNLLRRVLTGLLAQRILPVCLSGMQTSWDIDESMIAALERIVRADRDDFHSRNKLRLLRVCKALCPLAAAADIAIILQCMLTVDPVLYDLLGGSSPDQVRASLADLCCWDRNPISNAQACIVEKLRAWGEEGPEWEALAGIRASFDNPRCALLANAELLALAAGLVDHFELRMGAPPYSLIRLISPGASPRDKRQCVVSFLRTPEHCLSLFCRRLRNRCPTESAMLRHGRGIVEAWAKGSFLDIGRTERSHGLMRQDVRSEHRARSFTRSANHSLCQELKAVHMQRGGTDPVTGTAGASPAEGASPPPQRNLGKRSRGAAPFALSGLSQFPLPAPQGSSHS